MGVYIKGMEMPKSCDNCPLGDSLCCCLLPGVPSLWAEYANAVKEKRLHSDCPLVPVPEHGRLIDADEFLKRAIGTKCFRGDYALMLEELVGESVTIIPAEEGE